METCKMSDMKNLVGSVLVLTISLILAGCSGQDDVTLESGKPPTETDADVVKIVTSFSMIEDMAADIGGEHAEVINLAPIGTDPHEYEPKPDDMKNIARSDLVFYNGLNLEGGDKGWLSKVLNTTDYPVRNAVELTRDVEPLYIGDKDNKEVNPHAFIDPHVGEKMIRTITDTLVEKNPKNKEYFRKNEEEYLKELHQIEKDYDEQMSSIPGEDRVFVTSEQAFQYLTTRYHLKEGYIWAIDTEENGSPEQIKNLVQFIGENEPPVLFVESNVDTRPMETVSRESNVPIYEKPLYSDEIGKKGEEGDTYLSYLKYNLEVITDGLTTNE